MFLYFLCTLPTFAGGFLLSVLVPNLFLMLAYSTAITVAMCNMIFPALCYLHLAAGAKKNDDDSKGGAAVAHVSDTQNCEEEEEESEGLEAGTELGGPSLHKLQLKLKVRDQGWYAVPLAWSTLAFGVATTVVCAVGAVGMTVLPSLRGPNASFC